jgi:TonB-linked SusC/RagA family outer membrane protein
MKAIFTAIVVCLFMYSGIAQQLTITGIIQDVNTTNALANVSIQEEGTGTGTLSNPDGTYAIKVSNNNATLLFSHIGYNTLQVKLNTKNQLNIFLIPNANMLTDVVVTALGIQRNKRELGYSIQTIRAKDLTEVRQTNLVNALAGRVAGVQVTNGSSGVGSSSRIVIRGENSLTGTNQPLFVVDGVPISNNVITNNTENNESGFQEVDYGNGAADINPDDVESITVLKGAGASALYGSRAAGGVIVIKTKDGTNHNRNQGIGVSVNSSVTFENPLILPKYQNVYGAGAGGKFFYEDGFGAGSNDGGLTSFGPKLDGQMIKQFNGPSKDVNGNPVRGADIIARNGNPITPTPFVAHPNNIKEYFKTGATLINNVSFNGSNDQSSFRISYTNLDNKGMMPNTDLKRNSLAFSGTSRLNDKLSARAYVNYIQSSSTNRPALGYGSENPMYTFNWTGRQVDTRDLKDYWQAGRKDFNQFNSNYLWLDNPYFSAFENTNGFDKKRILGNASINYDFNQNFSLRFRSGIDYYHDLRASKRAFSTKRFANGAYREDEVDYNELNTDVLLMYAKEISKSFRMTLSAGGNILTQKTNYKSTTAGQLSVPNIYNFGNSKIPLVSYQEVSKKQINSLYAFGNFAYKNYLFADVTFRNDWSSTLPQNNNSYPYYSASLALLLSEVTRLPQFISYAKLRLSAATVGNDTDPYQLNNTFVFNQNYGSSPLLTNSTRLLNPSLTPEKLDALEAGAEVYFIKDRLGIDASIYQNTSSNQIINLPSSTSSGFVSRLVNGGSIRSKGVEIMLKGSPVVGKNFRWNTYINFSQNKSRVVTLPDGVDQYITGTSSVYTSATNSVFFIATPQNGGRIGDIYGKGFVEIDGKTLYDAKGFPVRDPNLRNLGNYNPDFMMGFGNDLTYKNFDLNFLWDWRQGGVFLSRIFTLGSTSGILESTLPGRETGIVGHGVTNTGTAGSPKYETNTKSIAANDYYGQYYNRATPATSMFDASYVKLRQVSLSYGIPKNNLGKMKINEIRVGVILNNVLLFTKNPNVDPEANALQGRKYVYGVDNMSLPSSRSYGFNLNIKF